MTSRSSPKEIEAGPSRIAERPSGDDNERVPTRDFGFLPIPRRVRHDPAHPQTLGLGVAVLFGFTIAVVVANLVYAQPLLIQLAEHFGVTHHAVSNVPTLLQAGYALGLLAICPLGDLVRRRPLILLLVSLCAMLSIPLAFTSNIVVFEIFSFFVGLVTVVPQVIAPLAVDLAPPERRAFSISIIWAGLTLGTLVGRALSGIVAQFITWRAVFYIAFGSQFALVGMLYWVLPDYPPKNNKETYLSVLRSMARYTVTEPLLAQAIVINLVSSACFTNFNVTLTFLLGGPAFNFSTLAIGLFALIGILGLILAPYIGRVIDKLVPFYATVIAVAALLLVYTLQIAAIGLHIAVVVIVYIGMDIFRQTQYVSLTSSVLGLDANARSRINAVLILSLFFGQVTGTAVGSKVFTQYGWRASAALNVGWTVLTLVVLLLRGPHVSRYTWFGWGRGARPFLAPRKEVSTPAAAAGKAVTTRLDLGDDEKSSTKSEIASALPAEG